MPAVRLGCRPYLRLAILLAPLCLIPCGFTLAHGSPMPHAKRAGTGTAIRFANSCDELFGSTQPKGLAAEASFAIPANAAMPTQRFEGTLTLTSGAASYFSVALDRYGVTKSTAGPAPYNRLPTFSAQFVSDGSYLFPVDPGFRSTGSTTWNLVLGTGRVWRETTDRGFMRAALPFAIVEWNQNCTHYGSLTFLFNRQKTPNISQARYQVTGETCPYLKFDMAGQVAAAYAPSTIPGAAAIAAAQTAEAASRIKQEPIGRLARDYPAARIDPAAILAAYTHPADVQTYGIVYRNTNYSAGCNTRHTAAGLGPYPFCDQMRMASYSTAKSAFVALASMRLAQLYGPEAYNGLLRTYVPRAAEIPDWASVTIGNAIDMATGHYISPAYEADENSPAMDDFLSAASCDQKIADALELFPAKARPGARFVYQSSASFLATQALNAMLKHHRGENADLFEMMADDVYRPLGLSRGFMHTLRCEGGATGAPSGYYGLFWSIDDIAKMGRFLATGDGRIGGALVIDPARLRSSLFRTQQEGLQVPDPAGAPYPNTFGYNHGFWGKRVTHAEFPSISCTPILPFMSGFGGITIMPFPNGAVFYAVSDAFEYPIDIPITQIAKLDRVSFCRREGAVSLDRAGASDRILPGGDGRSALGP